MCLHLGRARQLCSQGGESRGGMPMDSCEGAAGVAVVSGSGELGGEDAGVDEALSEPTADFSILYTRSTLVNSLPRSASACCRVSSLVRCKDEPACLSCNANRLSVLLGQHLSTCMSRHCICLVLMLGHNNHVSFHSDGCNCPRAVVLLMSRWQCW